jgi:hypothetical protein
MEKLLIEKNGENHVFLIAVQGICENEWAASIICQL